MILLYTGAPRTEKTRSVIAEINKSKNKKFIYVSRTINTINNVESQIKDKKVIKVIQKEEICEHFRKYKDTINNKMNYGIMSMIICKRMCSHEECKYEEMKKQIKDADVILTTYTSFRIIKDIKPDVIIFDEARHITSQNIIREEPMSRDLTYKNHKQILSNYVKEVGKLKNDINKMRNILKIQTIEALNHSLSIYIGHILTLTEPEIDTWESEMYVTTKIDGGQDYILNSTHIKDIKQNIITDENIEIIRILTFAEKIQYIKHNRLCVDIISNNNGENNINVIIENTNYREDYTNMIDNTDRVILIDSTPFPKGYRKFWLGKNYNMKEVIFKPKYLFNIVIECKVRRQRDIWGAKVNIEREMTIESNIINKLIDNNLIGINNRKYHIFTRSKHEQYNLNNELKHRIKNYNECVEIHVARGKESEGIQLFGYVCIWGLPLQNIHSERYRFNEFKEYLGHKLTIVKQKYHSTKAYQELLQCAFRTAYYNEQVGCILRHIPSNVYKEIEENFTWLKSENISMLRLIEEGSIKNLDIKTRSDWLYDGMTLGTIPKYTSNELRIMEDIKQLLEKVEKITKSELITSLRGKVTTKRKVLNIMIKEKTIIETKTKMDIKPYWKKVLKLPIKR